MNSLIIFSFANKVLALCNILMYVRREEDPSFLPDDECIPCCSCEWVYVDGCTRAFGTHKEPSVRRTTVFAYETKKIIAEIARNFVVGWNRGK